MLYTFYLPCFALKSWSQFPCSCLSLNRLSATNVLTLSCSSLLFPSPTSLQNYPPLVEARAGNAPSMSALAVFRDLTEEQWQRFMCVVRFQIARKLLEGAWKQAQPSKAVPLMSCPRF